MTERISKRKEALTLTRPSLSAERARLATEAYEASYNEAPVVAKAHMLAHILAHMTIQIQEGELIVGNHTDKLRCAPVYPEYTSQWIVQGLDHFSDRGSDPLEIELSDQEELSQLLLKWKGKSLDERIEKALPASVKEAEASGVMTVGNRDCATGHIIPDYPFILKNGLLAYRQECEQHMRTLIVDSRDKQEQMDFWEAVLITIDAAEMFAGRYAEQALELAEQTADPKRQQELRTISKICRTVPLHPAESFQEAIQCVWFLHLIITIESNGHGNSFARFDQYINPFYKKDVQAGTLTYEEALEIVECFFIKATEIIKLRDSFYSESFAGYPVWQNLVIGGQTAQGADAANETSHLILEANARVQTSQPTVSLRYFDGISQDLLEKGLAMVQEGMSTPAFFNDKLVVPMIMEKTQATVEEAREWAILGCVEPCIPGSSDGRPTVGYINLLNCVELALFNGVDQMTRQQLGPATGQFTSFVSTDDLKRAFYQQVDHFAALMVEGFNIVGSIHAVYSQVPFASMTVNDCVARGRSVQNAGARFQESGAFICGIGNAADALAAIDTLVFTEGKIGREELLQALAADFKGEERLRLMLLHKAPKYGNDIESVDQIAADILAHYKDTLSQYRDSRGAAFTVVVESQSLNVSQGRKVIASADGRHRAEPLNDNCSPVMGRDQNGPTAAVRSVARLGQKNAQDGCLYNLRFDPRSVQGSKGREILHSMIRTYFDNMGEHIQINVVDDQTLKKAQIEPEKYSGLLVRVAGYLAYFTELDKDVQDNIIARTAHIV
ncbi:MAG: glycyl radical protein [Lachnospiraceae bacterium]